MSCTTFHSLADKPKLLQDSRTSTRLYSYGSNKTIPVIGTFTADVLYGDNTTQGKFAVTKISGDTLLCYKAAAELGIVNITNNVNAVNYDADHWLQKYSDLCVGIGKLKDVQIKLHEDKTVMPVAQPHDRRMPFHVQKKTAEELQKLLNLDIIDEI
ncbi:uncharacterized protein LOC144433144 [Glandiceps talaboti]